jgi:hypothetical protein
MTSQRGPRRRLARWRHGCRAAAALALVGGVASLVGYTPETRVRIVREDGSPVAGAYGACFYSGYRFNFVDSISYERPGRVVRSDAGGRLSLPRRLYWKGPLDTHATGHLLLLYAPGLHHARRVWSLAESPGEKHEGRVSGGRLVLRGLREDPASWERSLDELHSFLRYEVVGAFESGRPLRVHVPAALARELARHLRAEVEAFALRHAATPREPPPSTPDFESRSPEEQRAILSRVGQDLAREPWWGPRISRRWTPRLDGLDRELARLD